MSNLRIFGQKGEKIAERFLKDRGYILLERNFRTPFGEVDLIFKEGECIVFVEVKYRNSTAYGSGEESITTTKKVHIVKSALYYLKTHHLLEVPFRFDVITITPHQITHYENAFYADDLKIY